MSPNQSYCFGHGVGSFGPNTRSGRRLFQDRTTPSTTHTPLVRTSDSHITHNTTSITSTDPSPLITHHTSSNHPTSSIDSTSHLRATQQSPSTHTTPHTTSTESTPSSHPTSMRPTSGDVSQNPTTSTAPKKNVRGPTVKTVEHARKPGDPRVRAEFFDGGSLTRSFVSSIGVWIKTYTIFPPNITDYDDATDDAKRAVYQRIADNFELVELHEDPNHPPVEPLPVGVGVQGQHADDPLLVLPASPGLRKCIAGHCNDAFRRSTLKLRRKYFDPHQNYEDKIAHVPPRMDPDHWRFLVDYWSTPEYEAKRKINKDNSHGNAILHTTGPVSFAVSRKRMVDEEGQVDEIKHFDETHTSKKGGFLTTQAAEASNQMKELKAQHTQSDGSCSLTSREIFMDVRGKKGKGRHLGHGARFQSQPRSVQADLRNMEARIRAQIEEEMQDKMAQMFATLVAYMPPEMRAFVPPHIQYPLRDASQQRRDREDQSRDGGDSNTNDEDEI